MWPANSLYFPLYSHLRAPLNRIACLCLWHFFSSCKSFFGSCVVLFLFLYSLSVPKDFWQNLSSRIKQFICKNHALIQLFKSLCTHVAHWSDAYLDAMIRVHQIVCLYLLVHCDWLSKCHSASSSVQTSHESSSCLVNGQLHCWA